MLTPGNKFINANKPKAGLNMLRIMIFVMSLVIFAGCSAVIDRAKLENDISLEEGQKPASIDIMATCSFGVVSADNDRVSSSLSTCVFVEDRVYVYAKSYFSDELEKSSMIKYTEMKSVALYNAGSAGYLRQLQIEGATGHFIFEILSSNGVFNNPELNERAHQYLIDKGVAEKQATNYIDHSASFIFLPIPNAAFAPFVF